MGIKKGTRKVEVWLHIDDLRVILAKALDDDLSDNLALSAIIQEWRENKEIEPLKIPPKLSDLEQLEQKLKNCQLDIEVLKRELRIAKL